jgi:tRNA nucleotidyltransferase (CCA-adding enzyme)
MNPSRLIALDPEIRAVVDRLAEAGHQAVLVGGAVRDALRGLPVKDYDLATSATPAEVMRLFPHSDGRATSFGTVFVPLGKGRLPVEVTSFRGDGQYSDGRRPDSIVLIGDLEGDLSRRDLTINAMAYDPRSGRLIDPHGGYQDLVARRLRATGNDPDRRLSEDALRAVRVARFVASTGFSVDPSLEAAIARAAPRVSATVSAERLGTELWRMVSGRHPRLALRLVASSGLLSAFFPKTDTEAGRRLRAALAVRDINPPNPPTWLALMAIVALPSEDRSWKQAAERLALGDNTIEATLGRMRVARLMEPRFSRPALLRALPISWAATEDGLLLRRLLWRAHLAPNDAGRLARRIATLRRLGLPRNRAELALNGDDLLALGFQGRDIGAGLEQLWLEVAQGKRRNSRAELLGRAGRLRAAS